MTNGVLERAARLRAKARGRSMHFLAWKALDVASKHVQAVVPPAWTYARAGREVERLMARGGPEGLREYLLARPTPRFFFDQEDVARILALLSEDPSYAHGVVARADAVRAHEIPVLSVGPVQLGDPIDWHRDYRSGLRWKSKPGSTMDVLDLERPSDVRICWELNRLHFLFDLAKAYRLTGDEKYAQEVVDLVRSWDIANPVGVGVNWTCALQTAVRAVNLIWALSLVLPAPCMDDAFLRRFVEVLLEHGMSIRRNLEYSDIRANHYLSDLVGLIWIGLFLPELASAREWLNFAVPRLEREIRHQVYEDGCTHEGSIPYHRFSMEHFLATGLFLERNGHWLSDGYWQRLEKMAEFVAAYVKPDGTCPLFGDTDDGRLHVLGSQGINDHRYLLAIAATRFGRGDFKAVSGRLWEEAGWILGSEGCRTLANIDGDGGTGESRGFEMGGWFFLKGSGSYVAIDCGDVGLRGRGGHGHCDILSIEAVFAGESIVVDRGSALYTASRSARRDVLLAGSHNLVLVDDADFADVVPYDIASVRNTPGRLLAWEVGPDGALFEGEHDGYAGIGVVHRRRVSLERATGAVRIDDRLLGQGSHTLTARFHLTPGCRVAIEVATCRVTGPGGGAVEVVVHDGSDAGSWETRDTTVYPSYGAAVPAVCLEWRAKMELPALIAFGWQAVEQPPDRARR